MWIVTGIMHALVFMKRKLKILGKTVIKIQGHLSGKWEECFKGMNISYEENDTILTGKLKGDAHLHGILNTIRDQNLTLISVNPAEN